VVLGALRVWEAELGAVGLRVREKEAGVRRLFARAPTEVEVVGALETVRRYRT
jgi:hypothetical protein